MPHTLFPRADAATKARLEADEVVKYCDDFAWSDTPLGAIPEWPDALRSAARMMMVSEVPMVMMAGEGQGVLIYNSGYAHFAGDRHPAIFGQPVLEAWPEVADFNRENLRRGFAGESWYLADEELVLNRTGRFESAWMNLNYSPVLDECGKVLAVLVIVVETTARFKAERALAQSQEKLELALHSSGLVGTWDWDIKRDRVTADERFAKLYSVPIDEAARGLPIEEFFSSIHPDDRVRVQADIAEAMAKLGAARFEYRLVQSDGSIRWVVASGKVDGDDQGRAARFPGVVVDITAERRIAEQLAESEQRFRLLADSMPQIVWSTLPDGFHDYYNARWYEYTGVPDGSTDGEGWNDMFHPEDQQRAWEVWRHSLETGEPYHIEYRLRHNSGIYRWVLGRALPMRDTTGRIIRWFGTCTDIHETKLAQEEREVIAQELSHRIKNIFAVIGGIVSLAARSHPEAAEFAERLRGRIFALGRAHDFVRPHSRASQPRANPGSLTGLVAELLQPYNDGEVSRVVFTGPDADIDDGVATPLALLFHELATNAAKYGALSSPEGRVEIATSIEGDEYRLAWREHGGPKPAPSAAGFGTKLISLSVEGQLHGRIERHFGDEGLEVLVTLPREQLRRKAQLKREPASPHQANQTA